MPFQQRSRSPNSEAAEPLYRDSSDEAEKHQNHSSDTQTQALQASIRRLRRWLIAVSIALAISCAYTLFSFRHVVRNHTTSKRLSFAPESTRLCPSLMPTPSLIKSPSPNKTYHLRKDHLRLSLHPRSRRSLGQRSLSSRRRLRAHPQPISLLPAFRRSARRLPRTARRGRDLRHLRISPTALSEPRAHLPVHFESGCGLQYFCRDL